MGWLRAIELASRALEAAGTSLQQAQQWATLLVSLGCVAGEKD
jgi:hypothetical protein